MVDGYWRYTQARQTAEEHRLAIRAIRRIKTSCANCGEVASLLSLTGLLVLSTWAIGCELPPKVRRNSAWSLQKFQLKGKDPAILLRSRSRNRSGCRHLIYGVRTVTYQVTYKHQSLFLVFLIVFSYFHCFVTCVFEQRLWIYLLRSYQFFSMRNVFESLNFQILGEVAALPWLSQGTWVGFEIFNCSSIKK